MQMLDLHQNEEQNNATGGHLVSQSRRVNVETAYQKKAEHLVPGENCFKICASQVRSIMLSHRVLGVSTCDVGFGKIFDYVRLYPCNLISVMLRSSTFCNLMSAQSGLRTQLQLNLKNVCSFLNLT